MDPKTDSPTPPIDENLIEQVLDVTEINSVIEGQEPFTYEFREELRSILRRDYAATISKKVATDSK